MSLTQPTLIPRPWAENGTKDIIPDTTTVTGRASWSIGFPEDNALPRKAGGIPPNWLDFQGVLHALSSHTVFEQAGGHYGWDPGTNYPVGACILGSNNQLYKALQESGPDTSAGAKNPVTAANSAYWGVLASPDGTTIQIVNGKLVAVGQGSDASALADNVTTVASGGKLSVDFTDVTDAARKKITPNILQTNGGLLADSTNGKLSVDFSGLHIPLWIGENGIGVNFYVDGVNGDDAETVTVSGTVHYRGRESAYPWKSVGYATQTLCKNYNLNTQVVYINVAGGTYNITADIALPLQQRTTGSVIIRPWAGTGAVNIVRTTTWAGNIFTHSGGRWYLRDLNLKMVFNTQSESNGYSYPHILSSTDSTGAVTLTHCNLEFEDNMQTPAAGVYGSIEPRLISTSGGHITIRTASDLGYSTTWSGTKKSGTINLFWMYAENGGIIEMERTTGTAHTINVSGSFTTFCFMRTQALYRNQGTGENTVFNPVSSPTGKRYELLTGAAADTGSGSGVSTYFPGNSSGSKDSNTYCWII